MKIREILEDTQRPNLNDAFRRWFAGSKVVDAKGNPLIVYHGTNQTIDKFATRRLGANTGTVSSKAFFFTEHPAEAGEYAALSARRQVSNAEEREEKAAYFQREIDRAYARNDFDRAEKLTLEYEASEQEVFDGHDIGANILPVYLSVKNPFVFDMEGKDLYALSAAIDHAKTNGYDGMHLKNVFDPVDDRPEAFNTIQWIVFKPTQIKSIFNRGTWNGRSAKISEDVERDIYNHKLATTIADRIVNFFRRDQDHKVDLIVHSKTRYPAYLFYASTLGIVKDIGIDRLCIGFCRMQKEQKMITGRVFLTPENDQIDWGIELSCLPWSSKTSVSGLMQDLGMMKDIAKHPEFRMTLIHELIHLFDYIRTKDKIRTGNNYVGLDADDPGDYTNHPLETNAHFHEIIDGIISFLTKAEKEPDLSKRIKLAKRYHIKPTLRATVEAIQDSWDVDEQPHLYDFFIYMDDKTRRSFYRRVFPLHQKAIKLLKPYGKPV